MLRQMILGMFIIKLMSEQTNTETIHSEMADPPSTSLPNQATAGGELTFGMTKPLPTLGANAWMARLFNEFLISSFPWNVSYVAGQLIFVGNINPFYGSNIQQDHVPWFLWYLQTCVQYEGEFQLELEAISHSSHRGVLDIHVMPSPGLTDDTAKTLFTNVVRYDLSGAERNVVIPIPNWRASMVKFVSNFANLILNTRTPPAEGKSYLPTFHFLDVFLCHLKILVGLPLVASDILPPEITMLLKLRPSPKVKFYGNSRPREQDPRLISNQTPQVIIRYERGSFTYNGI